MSTDNAKLLSFLDELINHAKGGMCIALPPPCADTLETLRHIVEWRGDYHKNNLSVRREGSEWLVDIGLSCSIPIIERLSEHQARVVIEMSEMAALALRDKFGLCVVPAPLDATEAIVRATHALAGTALEMTHLLKDLQKPTITPQLDFMELLRQVTGQTKEKGTDDDT